VSLSFSAGTLKHCALSVSGSTIWNNNSSPLVALQTLLFLNNRCLTWRWTGEESFSQD